MTSLTTQQERMRAFIGGMQDTYYLMIESFVLRGSLDRAALQRAVTEVLARHDVCRAVYPTDGGYRVAGSAQELIGTVWADGGAGLTTGEALRAGLAHCSRPLTLDREPPLRFWVAEVAADEHVVVIAGHHLVFDAWTFMLFYEELAMAYRGEALPDPVQYADAQPPSDPAALDGWDGLFCPGYRRTRALAASVASVPKGPAVVHRRQWPGLTKRVTAAAKHYRVTPFVIGSVAFARALADILGDSEVIFGSAYAGRTSPAAASALGYYSTTLFVGVDLAGRDTADLAGTVRDDLRRWHRTPRIQWEDLLTRYRAEDLYPVKFAFQPTEMAERKLQLPHVSTEKVHQERPDVTARRPVDLIASYDADGVTASMTARTDGLSRTEAEALVDGFGAYLDQAGDLPD